ncbi:recombinase RecT [Nonomuraea sp. GTA35]|uniref:recombinase RecT n=1 Tax=Nonomuraea sp. GTA35 TaxID=1676746 RepID=UPI0035C22131
MTTNNGNLAARVAQRAGGQEVAPQQETGPAPVAEVVDLAQRDTWLRWLNERRTYFADALPRHIDESQFIQAALTAMYKTEKLQECTPESLMMALMQCARFGLDPDGVHAAVVPYGKTATFVPMYMGYIELMYRSGMVESVVFDHIHDTDKWRYNQAQRPPDDFEHEVDLINRHDGNKILAYAFCWMKTGGRSQIMFLNRREAEEIRDTRSKAYQLAERNRRQNPGEFAKNPHWGKYNSTWHTDFDAMWLKSPVRRLNKRVPTSPEIRELLKIDDQLDVMERLAVPLASVPGGRRPEIEPPSRTADEQEAIAPPPGEDEAGWPPVRQPGGAAESEAS